MAGSPPDPRRKEGTLAAATPGEQLAGWIVRWRWFLWGSRFRGARRADALDPLPKATHRRLCRDRARPRRRRCRLQGGPPRGRILEPEHQPAKRDIEREE